MSTKSQDFISECMESMPKQGSLEDFTQGFCSVCINPDCKRSRWADSRWMTRMILQEQALRQPVFADPDDPKYVHLQNTHFEEVDQETLQYYGGWVDVREDGSVVNHAPGDIHEKGSSKVDEALKSLRSGKSPEEVLRQSLFEEEEEYEIPSEPEPEIEEPDEVEPEPEPARRPQEPAPQVKPTVKKSLNTEVPKSGILLGTQAPVKQSSILTSTDPWAVPSGGTSKRGKNGKLTVRVSDGKVVKGDG